MKHCTSLLSRCTDLCACVQAYVRACVYLQCSIISFAGFTGLEGFSYKHETVKSVQQPQRILQYIQFTKVSQVLEDTTRKIRQSVVRQQPKHKIWQTKDQILKGIDELRSGFVQRGKTPLSSVLSGRPRTWIWQGSCRVLREFKLRLSGVDCFKRALWQGFTSDFSNLRHCRYCLKLNEHFSNF